MTIETRWHPVADEVELSVQACAWVTEAAADALRSRGVFSIALAGGNTPRGAYRLLRQTETDWRCWQVYFSDERCLMQTSRERNSVMAREAWLDHVPLPNDQMHVIPAERGPYKGAADYAEVLRDASDFDLVLLGLGEDGHTASLFPGHELGAAPDSPATLAIVDAPKPPAARVSLSAARLSRASRVLFLVVGESKRAAVASWRAGAAIPAGAIAPRGGVDVLVEAGLIESTGAGAGER
jgi:6-phosphogluconolactonase